MPLFSLFCNKRANWPGRAESAFFGQNSPNYAPGENDNKPHAQKKGNYMPVLGEQPD
jgi:hypothetical protein